MMATPGAQNGAGKPNGYKTKKRSNCIKVLEAVRKCIEVRFLLRVHGFCIKQGVGQEFLLRWKVQVYNL